MRERDKKLIESLHPAFRQIVEDMFAVWDEKFEHDVIVIGGGSAVAPFIYTLF